MTISWKHKAIIVLLKATALCEQRKGRTNNWINELVTRLTAGQRTAWRSHTLNVNRIEERLIPLINMLSPLGINDDITQEDFECSLNNLTSGLLEGDITNQSVLEYIKSTSDNDALEKSTITQLLQIWYTEFHCRGQIVDLTKARHERSTAADVRQSQSQERPFASGVEQPECHERCSNYSTETVQLIPEPDAHMLRGQPMNPIVEKNKREECGSFRERQNMSNLDESSAILHFKSNDNNADLSSLNDLHSSDDDGEHDDAVAIPKETRHPLWERLHTGRRRCVSESNNSDVSSLNDQESSDGEGEIVDAFELPPETRPPLWERRLHTGRRRCVSESDAQTPIRSKSSILNRFNGEGSLRRMAQRTRCYSEGDVGRSHNESQRRITFTSQPSVFNAANLSIRFQIRDL